MNISPYLELNMKYDVKDYSRKMKSNRVLFDHDKGGTHMPCSVKSHTH